MILVTGAAGQIGTAFVRHLRLASHEVLASDYGTSASGDVVCCDLRSDQEVADLFERRRFSAVVHLAAVLPTAFRLDPLNGGEVNLSGSIRLLRAAIRSGVTRFIFASSASVYGNLARCCCTEDVEACPDEPYGAAKLAIERILEVIPTVHAMEIVSLRIARVLGPGAKGTGSRWRSQTFERPHAGLNRLTIPFAPDACLSVVHVHDVARMLRILVEVPRLQVRTYNAPVEAIRADELRHLVERINGWQVSMGKSHGGPEIDGSRFAQDFGFALRSLDQHMSNPIP